MVQRVAVDVQVQVAPVMPAFAIVGLPDKVVSEARARLRSALIASGLALPARRITINLAPADLRSHYDLLIGSREVAERVALARERQAARYAAIGLPHIRTNAAVSGAILEDVAPPDRSGLTLLREAADAMRLSARGYHRVLRVARTLADLDGADKVGRVHLVEALSYRALADEVRRAA
jgi:predicted ATPase with chaperone activity